RVLSESSEVWEAALAREVERALASGRSYAQGQGMQFTQLSETDQQAFDRAYQAAARAQAHALAARGVDGDAMLHDAQAWIARLRAGTAPLELCARNPS
ncbi:MAG TPA: hypothetical protein VJR89_32615, partial [Polyangiales bacterium]|nr:hypothetical protein [Polyangiales bacterium]